MKHPKLILMCLFALTAISTYCQTDFRPAYYITHDNDTIHGLIDYRGDQRNTKVCIYRSDEDSDPVNFGPDEIAAFRFQQGKYYISKWLEINNEKSQVFAEYLVNGITDLFYYRDHNGDHYFLEKEDGEVIELKEDLRTVEVDGKVYTRDTKRHIGLLKSAFSDCSEIQPDLETATLSHKSLITLTSEYHGYVCEDEQCLIYEKELPSVKLGIAPVLGYGSSSIRFPTYALLDHMEFESSISPYLGVQLNLNSPRLNEKLYLQLDAGIVRNYFYAFSNVEVESAVHYVDVHLNSLFMHYILAFKYKFPKGRVRPTIAAGGLASHMIKNEIRYIQESQSEGVVYAYETNSLPMAIMHWGGMLQAGLDFELSDDWTCFAQFRYQVGRGSNYENQFDQPDQGIDKPELLVSNLSSFSILIGIYF